MTDISYTTEEIAQLLKISKLTVYDLIKKGQLTAYRVGKQMRVDHSDLEAYKQRSKGVGQYSSEETRSLTPVIDAPANPPAVQVTTQGVRQVVITGQDMSLDILVRHIEKRSPGIRPLRSYVGSLDSLISMYQGHSDIVSTHLLDGDTGEYNIPYIRKLLIGCSYKVVNLMSRRAGLYVQPGNPHELHEWKDLAKSGIRMVNRERGAGARVLLEEQLRMHGIAARELMGYYDEESNHLAVAGRVASKQADVGVGIEKAATIVQGVEFIPLTVERYDLVLINKPENEVLIRTVLDILRSESFIRELGSISGYDLSRTGEVLFEA
ncbi:putative molybdopterin biosynthesis protein [Paenibacillus sp. PDC88]|nr:helix-turn-helix transcriptional regulator [Paenibacillus sp. PDC88]SDX11537.1 putative molybdopterin biosynthesis protein [Paenibacillus sp. PDC88]